MVINIDRKEYEEQLNKMWKDNKSTTILINVRTFKDGNETDYYKLISGRDYGFGAGTYVIKHCWVNGTDQWGEHKLVDSDYIESMVSTRPNHVFSIALREYFNL